MGKLLCPCGHLFSDVACPSDSMHVYRDRDRDEHSFHSWRSFQLSDVERAGMLPDRDTPESEQFHESLYRMLELEGELWECPGCGRLHLRRPGEQSFRVFGLDTYNRSHSRCIGDLPVGQDLSCRLSIDRQDKSCPTRAESRVLQVPLPMPEGPRNPPILDPPIRLAVCVSGGGTTLRNLLDRTADGRLGAEVVRVVASRPSIGAIEKAERAGVPVSVEVRGMRPLGEFGAAVFDPIRRSGADLVILGGFLNLLPIPADYAGRVINIHPSLIPAFSGKGFHGRSVHQAAIDSGVKLSGCTVHFADDTYDTGPIIFQIPVPVLHNDSAETLAARVFEAECEALPEAIRLYAEGKLTIVGRKVRIG